MLSKVLLAIAAIVAAFLAYVAVLPSDGTISRSAVLAAKPDAIFPHVATLKKWDAWSPWAKLDPNAKNTFEGPESGVGSIFHWDGNSDVGAGKMTVLESKPNEHVKIELDFERPMQGKSFADFALQPEGDGTRVTWTMSGERPFFQRAICVLLRADAMVAGMFDKGLASLGAVAAAK